MKRILIAILLCTVLILSACSSDAQPTPQGEATPDKPVAIGIFTESDLVFAVESSEFPLNSDVAPLLEAFGKDYDLTTAPSCVYDGEDKVFDYSFASIFTYPTDGKDLIDEIYIFGEDYKTNKGIGIGSTLDEIKAQYGDGGFLVDSTYFYVLSGDVEDLKSPKLYFDLSEDKVIGISYYAASNITE